MFNKKAKKPTKAEAARMARLKEMPCVACLMRDSKYPAMAEVHHLLIGNKRRGHMFTIPLCAWHHRGYPWTASRAFANQFWGPSLALSSKDFHATYGSDAELLARTNKLLETTS